MLWETRDRKEKLQLGTLEEALGEGGPAWSLKRWVTATKKNEILPFAATWTDLEIIIPAEGNQAEKDKYLMIPLMCGI